MTTSALRDVRVLDLTTTFAGPYCARLLADIGMDVIKIEAPGGETTRNSQPLRKGASSNFGHLNAGKKSVELNLRSSLGASAFKRLVRDADILVENYRPGVMQRLGLDYEALRSIKPDLIYCAISGYGQTGPSSRRAAYAPSIHASSGFDLAHLASQPGRTMPDVCAVSTADFLTGTYAFGAIMAAVAIRDRTGAGQMIDVSMLESMLSLMVPDIQRAQFEVPPTRAFFGPVPTSDGYIMPVLGSERTFAALVRATKRDDWRTDARFAVIHDRRRNWRALIDELTAWTRMRTTAECRAAFDAAGVPCSPYRTVAEAMEDPQIAHRGALAIVSDRSGTLRALNPPFKYSAHRASVGERVADLGEHTELVLHDAGMTASEIAAVTGDATENARRPPDAGNAD